MAMPAGCPQYNSACRNMVITAKPGTVEFRVSGETDVGNKAELLEMPGPLRGFIRGVSVSTLG